MRLCWYERFVPATGHFCKIDIGLEPPAAYSAYALRISYMTPPDKEGTSALHGAAQSGRTDIVRYLLEKGANPVLVDANGKKPIDLLDAGGAGANAGRRGRGGAGAAPAAGAAGRGAAGGGGINPATAAEIRAMLQEAASKR